MKILQFAVVLFFTGLALNLSDSFPFYYAWDMDLTIVQDLFLLNSNQMPTHLNHPGLGLYWLHYWINYIAQSFGFLTDVNIFNLDKSFEPIVLIAEHVAFIRSVNALICILMPLVLWQSLKSFVRLTPIQSFISLVCFLTIPGIWRYNIPLVRTETYSLLFWTLSILCMIKASRATTAKLNTFYLLICGLFAGISFFTKIQSFFLIALTPLLYLLIHEPKTFIEKPIVQKNKYLIFLFFFGIISYASMNVDQPWYIATFAQSFGPNNFNFLFVGLFILLALISTVKFKKKLEAYTSYNQFISFMNPFMLGSAFVLILPLLMPMHFLNTIQYSLLSFKMVFMRIIDPLAYGQKSYLKTIKFFIIEYWPYALICTIALLVILWLNKITKRNYKFYVAILALLVLALHIILATRASIQDGIWVELPILIIFILLCASFEKSIKFITPIALLFTFLNIFKLTEFKNFTTTTQIAPYDSLIFFEEVYEFKLLEQPMSKIYTSREQKNISVNFATRWKEWKNILSSNFNNELTLRDISPFENGMMVHLNKINSQNMNIFYRPDLRQTIYFPDEITFDVLSNNCELIEPVSYTYLNKKYTGYTLKSKSNKGKHYSKCSIDSNNFSKSFMTVTYQAMTTLRDRH